MMKMGEIVAKLYLLYLRWICEHKDLMFISKEEIDLNHTLIHNHKWVCKRCGKVILSSHMHNNTIKKEQHSE